MRLFLIDFKVLRGNGSPVVPFDLAVSFAISSAFSLPRMSMWPGIHTIEISVPGRRALRESMLSSTADMTDCPDWCEGEVEAFMAGWLSA